MFSGSVSIPSITKSRPEPGRSMSASSGLSASKCTPATVGNPQYGEHLRILCSQAIPSILGCGPGCCESNLPERPRRGLGSLWCFVNSVGQADRYSRCNAPCIFCRGKKGTAKSIMGSYSCSRVSSDLASLGACPLR